MGDRLAGKVAVVTGSGNGIGQGCALMFAREGATVVGADLDVAGSEQTIALAEAEGLTLDSVHPCDLTDPAQVEALVAHTVERHGGLHILLNAAAWIAFEFIEDMDYEAHWKRTIVGELDIVFLGCKAAWPHLKASGGGSIINFSSANAYEALQASGALAHCATKGGVLAMTRQLAMEGGPHNIRANTICPALIVTSATKPRLDNEPGFREIVTAKMMLPRLGTPDDIAYCATFLASDESSWVTASDYKVDGGATSW
jgi:NAD(P)-dependent dehydrogenase (short-subunit alcohol dehydrogenase family)